MSGQVGEEREHWLYADENGNPEECIEDCPGCFPEDYADQDEAAVGVEGGEQG